ncbi:hypothetical protein [Schnuerera ultunensis]|uniref:hypothetical protein n=1 Tax=Schnuerera ultunensis TaxID=45497 RepID=UPI0012FD4B2F|nr:hypothetical protein [Schnuerera ultunensis]
MKETIVISTKRPTGVKGLKYQLHSSDGSFLKIRKYEETKLNMFPIISIIILCVIMAVLQRIPKPIIINP